MTENRKADHIDLAFKSQLLKESLDGRFYYEPLLGIHPKDSDILKTKFLGKELNFPLWISSMTGGAQKAHVINHNLSSLAAEFKIGFALGSIRPLIDDDKYFEDFNVRKIIGNDGLFFANIGIAQLEELVRENKLDKIHSLVDRLKADGLIIHINPIQEWLQPEGDRFQASPIETISLFLTNKKYPIIVKEVGQGMGPLSLKALLDLGVDVIELGAFGGTNFAKLESIRNESIHQFHSSNSLVTIGHTAEEMIHFLNHLLEVNPNYKKTEIIISGGISNALDGQYHRKLLKYNSLIGIASRILRFAENKDELFHFLKSETQTLLMAEQFLNFKKDQE